MAFLSIWHVMLYGCESWAQRKDDEKRTEAAEIFQEAAQGQSEN